MDGADYTRDAEAFTRALNAEHYLAGAGLRAGLDVVPIYERFGHLFEGERFEESLHWDLDPAQVSYLRDFIATGYLDNQVKDLDERLAAAESAATVDWDERPIPYRSVPGLIANEGDAVRRHDLERRHLEVMATLHPLQEEREKRLQRHARGFGFSDYVDLYDQLRSLNLADLTGQFQRLIDSTDELYFSALDTYLGEMRILRDDARKCDLARIFRGNEFDEFFPQDRMLHVLHNMVQDLGIRLEDQSNIRLDTEYRPLKSPRAFCCPIRVPDDVRLVIKPAGGMSDYEALLHEAGHAEHFANVDRTLPFAFRCLGDSSVTESYAFLFEYMLNDEGWLGRHLTDTRPAGFLQRAGFHRLYFLRRYGTKLSYEQLLHRADEPGDLAPVYDDMFTRSLGVGYGPEAYLADLDDGFYCAQYVRAWIFEAQHRSYLEREFDAEWYRNPKAAKFIVELWREGQKYPVEQLARFMGYDGLDPAAVLEDIRTLMGVK